MRDARVSIEFGIGVIFDGVVRVEGAECKPTSRAQAPSHTRDNNVVFTVRGHHPERPLTQADDCVELSIKGQRARIGSRKRCRGDFRALRNFDEPFADINPMHFEPSTSQFEGVPTRATADIEDPLPSFQSESRDKVVDLLDGALSVRVPVIGRPEMIGNIFEPVFSVGHAD